MNRVWLSVRDEPTDQFELEAEVFAYHLLVDHRQAMHRTLGENLDLATYYGIPASKMTIFGGFA